MTTPPMHPVLNGGTFGMMSGENPLFHAHVDASHENLVNTLRAMGLKHDQTHGRYGDPERSVIIHNPREDQMKTLGKLFGQESVIHSSGGKHKLIYTNGPHEGKFRGTVPAQQPHEWFDQPPEDYYTHLPGAGHFRINFDFDQEPQGQNADIKPGMNKKELLPGGKGDNKADSQFADAQLRAGIREEMKEHGLDAARAKEIAKDHLVENPKFYRKSIFQRLNLKKALPHGAKLTPDSSGNSPANVKAGNEHAVMTDQLLEQGTDRGVQPTFVKPIINTTSVGLTSRENVNQDELNGWLTGNNAHQYQSEPVANWRQSNEPFRTEPDVFNGAGPTSGDVTADQRFWAHPNFYEWHDGHTDHHSPRPWDKKTAMDTARGLGLIKNVPGDPSFDKQFNVFHEADHGSYRMSGGLHNRLQNPQSISLTYTSKQRSLIPGRSGRPVSLGTFPNKHQAYAAQLAHHDRVAAGLHKSLKKAVNDQAAGVGVSSYARFAAPYGQVTPGTQSNLMHYDYQNKLPAVQDLVKKHGFQVYYAGGKYGKPDLANKNYNTGHLMIYDPSPQSGGDFGQQDYTNAWRQVHELAHALTYPELNQTYGEGRRIGKLGTHRTLNEAQRAVHWEHLAAHKQRELNKQIGIHVPDHVFNKEYNTVMHDAIHRAVTGQFTEPAGEGFTPHEHQVPLSHALDMVRNEGKAMGLSHQHALIKKPSGPSPMAKALPHGAKLSPPVNSPANVKAGNEHAVMTDQLLERGTEVPDVDPSVAYDTKYRGHPDASRLGPQKATSSKAMESRISRTDRSNEIADQNRGWDADATVPVKNWDKPFWGQENYTSGPELPTGVPTPDRNAWANSPIMKRSKKRQ